VETRITRDMSRRPKSVWQVRQDSAGSWIRHGRTVHYFLNGQASAIEWYRDGKLDGKASYWHSNGAKQGEIAYIQGKADGQARTWYDDGAIESEKIWKMGRLESLRQFDRRGRASDKSFKSSNTSDSIQPGK
jgi:antitoxin component YwqK of YwqJK toxin-antitoxin module